MCSICVTPCDLDVTFGSVAMEILEAFYRRKLKKKQKKLELFHSELELSRAPSVTSVGVMATSSGNSMATGLISRVLRLTRSHDRSPLFLYLILLYVRCKPQMHKVKLLNVK